MKLKTSKLFLVAWLIAGGLSTPALAINSDSGFDKGKLAASEITPDCSHWSGNLSCAQGNQQAVDDVLDAFVGGSGITFTDGTHTVTGSTKLTVTGGTVGGSTPNATLLVTGGSGLNSFTSPLGSILIGGTLTDPTIDVNWPDFTMANMTGINWSAFYPTSNPFNFLKNITGYVMANVSALLTGTGTAIDPYVVGVNWQDLQIFGHSGVNWSDLVTLSTNQTIRGNKTFAGTVNLSALTASQILATDGSKNVQTLAVATYPSLTELSYVKGVTSAIQTQINGKQASGTYVTAVSVASANGFSGSSSGGATPALTLQTSISGVLKGSSNALAAAGFADVIALWSGCSGTQYLGYDGNCHTPGSGVTWPTSGNLVISNATNSPAGLAEVDGDCVVGAGGSWTAGSCGGGSQTPWGSDINGAGYKLTNAGINWDNIANFSTNGINWANLTFKFFGVNWATLYDIGAQGVNWYDLSITANQVTAVNGDTTKPQLNLPPISDLVTPAANGSYNDGTNLRYTPFGTSETALVGAQMMALTGTRTMPSSAAAPIFNVGSSSTGGVTLNNTTTYYFKMMIYLSSLNSTTGTVSLTFATTGTIGSIFYQAIANHSLAFDGTPGTATIVSVNQASASVVVATATTTTATLQVTGIIRMTATGTVTPEISESQSGTPVVAANSYFLIYPMGTNTATTIGNIV